MIDDGEPERKVGERFSWFGLGFWAEDPLTKSATRTQSADEGENYSYHVVAEIVHVSEQESVIDFGLWTVGPTSLLPAGCKRGDYIIGEVYLNFPLAMFPKPDDIKESMTQEWTIKRIVADLTPWRPGDETNRWFVLDGQRAAYEEVNATLDKVARSYVLRCVQEDI